MRFFRAITILILSFFLTNCINYDFSRRIVKQGNLLPADKVAKLHTGMAKSQVLALMGTSINRPLFNNNRWDYSYTFRVGSGPVAIKSITLCFKNDILQEIIQHPG